MSMVPVFASNMRGEWVIYLRPTYGAAKRHMIDTHGKQYDPVERSVVVGGVPAPFVRVPGTFASEAEARASLKLAA